MTDMIVTGYAESLLSEYWSSSERAVWPDTFVISYCTPQWLLTQGRTYKAPSCDLRFHDYPYLARRQHRIT